MTKNDVDARIEALETELTDLERSVQDSDLSSEAMEDYRTKAADIVREIASLKILPDDGAGVEGNDSPDVFA